MDFFPFLFIALHALIWLALIAVFIYILAQQVRRMRNEHVNKRDN